MADTVIEEKLVDINIGDLVEITHISPATSFFGWSGVKYGIYLGMFEFTHYISECESKTDMCHKVWISGEVKYVSTSQELKVLAPVEQTNE
tara:strand:+ start:54 stop:326 length:273 start_codon:yes stop_codon:yes gene_type:complete